MERSSHCHGPTIAWPSTTSTGLPDKLINSIRHVFSNGMTQKQLIRPSSVTSVYQVR